MTRRTIFLISCGKRKRNHRSRAEDLYVGALFTKSLAYARRQKADTIFILSAKHGLVELGDELDPYEQTLKTMTPAAIQTWSAGVVAQLQQRTDLKTDCFVFLTGVKYSAGLMGSLAHAHTPLKGLRLGKQLQFLGSASP